MFHSPMHSLKLYLFISEDDDDDDNDDDDDDDDDDIICENGGSSDDGHCSCRDGFVGKHCETRMYTYPVRK